jgi:uncharacterized protein (TIGR02594 family)
LAQGDSMEHWDLFGWITYVTILISAIFIAIREATRSNLAQTNRFRLIVHYRYLAYLPIVLITISGSIMLLRASGVIRPESSIGIATRPLSKLPPYLGPHTWLAVAFEEAGQRRYRNGSGNPRILTYLHSIPNTENKTELDDWASAFAEWSLNQVGISGPKNMAPRAWLNWGFPLSEGREGCIVILSFRGGDEHIGFLLAQDRDSVVVLAGNTVDEVGMRRYQKSDVLAYRWPTKPP